jgi:hypothetical protein
VHKNIRPETILVANCQTSGTAPLCYLFGFGEFRKEEGKTALLGDDTFEKNIYRHATRQGTHPESDYIMQHDIYSLGVCLLEIGLWHSLVIYDTLLLVDCGSSITGPSELLKQHVTLPKEKVKEYLLYSGKDQLIDMANRSLPYKMGTKYADVVVTCLSCLDEGNLGFGDPTELQDKDGIRVGARYIEKVSQIPSHVYFR